MTAQQPSKMRQTCVNLRLDRSKITFIEDEFDRSCQICCVCTATNAKNPYHDCVAVVETRSETGRWSDRYICRFHYPLVQQALRKENKSPGRPPDPTKKPVIAGRTEIEGKGLIYSEVLLNIFEDNPGKLLSFDFLLKEALKLRRSVNQKSLRSYLQRSIESGLVLPRRKYGGALYRLKKIPLSRNDRVVEFFGKPSERHGWVEHVQGDRVVAFFPDYGQVITHVDRLDFIDNLIVDRQIAKIQERIKKGEKPKGDPPTHLPWFYITGLILPNGRPDRNALIDVAKKLGYLRPDDWDFVGRRKAHAYNQTITYLDRHYPRWRDGVTAALQAN